MKHLIRLSLSAMLAAASISAQNAPDSSAATSGSDVTATPPAVQPSDSATQQSEAPTPAPRDRSRDTIFVLTRSSARELIDKLPSEHFSTRQRGYGGCIGPTVGVFGLDMRPVRELLRKNPEYWQAVGADIRDGLVPVAMFGGVVYGGLGHGGRIGLMGRGGSKSFADIGDGGSVNTTNRVVQVRTGYGGFMIEKSFVVDRFNILLGGTIGAGGITVKTSEAPDSVAWGPWQEQGTASVAVLLVDLHAGFTYSFLSWIHAGLEMSAPAFMSTSGFKRPGGLSMTNGFWSVNPGLQFRIVLGNIG